MPKPVISPADNASSEVETLRQQVEALTVENEHLKLLVAKYRHMHFGQKAETQEQLGQLDLGLAYEPLAIPVAESVTSSPAANEAAAASHICQISAKPRTVDSAEMITPTEVLAGM